MANIISGSSVSEETLRNMNDSLSHYITNVIKKHLNEIFMVDAESGECTTRGEVLDKSYKIAALLTQHGCSSDDVIGIVCENSFEFPSVLLAGLHIGAACTCINPLYSTNELQHAFNISKPRFVFASSKTYDKVESIHRQCNSTDKIINIEHIELNELSKDLCKAARDVKPTDTALIMYSSGTTGLSKGVQLMHRSFIYLMEMYRTEKIMTFPENNVVSGILPMSHAYGLFTVLQSLVLGHKYILIKRYNENSFLGYIEKYKISTVYAVPSIALFLAKDEVIYDYDLSSVKIISCGGAPLRPETEESLKKRFNCHVLQHYGMTETTTMTLYSTPDNKPGTTGRLLPGLQAKIVDLNTGINLGPSEQGEYCVKGPLLMKGYCDPENNDSPIDSEGWLHSGDIAYYDDQHNFYVIDRLKELIKYKGFQVPPAELEILILQHKCVQSVGVVGVPDEVSGELPRAYVVKKPGADEVTEDDILRFVSENISPQKKLRGGVKFVNHLPKTVSGKVDRKELKKWAAAGL